MAEVSDAYARGDEERIRAILRDWHASPEGVQGDGPGAELVRVIRKIAQVEKRLKTIATDMEQRRQGELCKLKQAVEEALGEGRDLLKELGERLDGEIVEARGGNSQGREGRGRHEQEKGSRENAANAAGFRQVSRRLREWLFSGGVVAKLTQFSRCRVSHGNLR